MEKIKHTYYPPCSVLEKTEQLPGSIENVKAAGAGGLNMETREFAPLDLKGVNFYYGMDEDKVSASAVFDVIAAAFELGIVNREDRHKQLFANSDTVAMIANVIREYEECYKFQEPWRQAFITLIYGEDSSPFSTEDEGFITAEQIAERLDEWLDELGEW